MSPLTSRKSIVEEVMSAPVRVVEQGSTLRDAAMVLSAARVSGAPVVDSKGQAVGMVTEADLLRIFQKQAALAKVVPVPGFAGVLTVLSLEEVRKDVLETFDTMQVSRAMSSPVVATTPETPLDDAAAEMIDRKVNRLPVLVGGKIVGIISRHDIVRALARLGPGR
ncbi:MAG TPA: CBS domain-containing protein [Thermoplasmata archaeon]|nr:CBS domain-containing protein [Thermoplasmata archaeon]